jgi:hypothetical protein
MASQPEDDTLTDAEIVQRMERGIQRFFATPPKPHGKNPSTPAPPKRKERPATKSPVHQAKSRS